MTRSEDKAKRDYVRGWESASRRPYPYKDVPTDNPRKRLGPALRIRELWQRDRLGVLGVGSALLAAGLFAAPNIGYDWGISLGAAHWPFDFGFSEWSKDPVEGRTGGWTAWLGAVIVFVQLSVEFTPGPNFSVGTDFYTFFQEWGSRLPAIAALLALSIILLLLRRR